MPARRLIAPALLLALAATAAPAVGQQKTFELRGNAFADVTARRPAARPDAPELDAVRSLVDRRQFGRAKKRAVAWLLARPKDPNRDRALLLASDALYGRGDRIRAFYYLDELMDENPSSPLFDTALQRQYRIADSFLNGYKQRFLLLPVLGGDSEAIEMLYRVRERAPGSPIAERSLRRTADYYYDDGQFDLAADTYGAFARAYPRSPDASDVRLRQAYSNLALFRGGKYDATPAVEGKAQIAQLAAADPALAEQRDLPELIVRIDRALAQKTLRRAEFYRRTGEPLASAALYRQVRARYPDLPESGRAAERLASLDVPDTPAEERREEGDPKEVVRPPLPSDRGPQIAPADVPPTVPQGGTFGSPGTLLP